MRILKKALVWLLGLALVLAAVVWAFQRQVGTALLQRVVQANVGRNIIPTLPDGLHVALCGTGSPFPDPTRAGPCTAIIAGERLFVVDAGDAREIVTAKADVEAP